MTNTTETRTAADIRREWAEKVERLEWELERALGPERRDLLGKYREAAEEAARWEAEENEAEHVGAFIRHFPALAPALRAIWQHLEDTDYGNSSECGLGPLARGGGPCRDSADLGRL